MSKILSERIYRYKQGRFNPIRNLTPAVLSNQIDWFDTGQLSDFSRTMDAIQERDYTLKTVIPKRSKSVSRLPWEIVVSKDAGTREGLKHQQALKYFYENLIATHAVDRDQRGGVSLLIEQMMDAQAKKYAVHELLWMPRPEGLTLKANFAPLWFFENRTGEMRFLEQDYAIQGVTMDPREWMVTTGDGLMRACSIAYMYKNLSLKDWVVFNEKYGIPGLVGQSASPKGSEGWDAMVQALADFANEFACVTDLESKISPIHVAASGESPFGPMIDLMDRWITTMWRGGDLGTISSGPASVGATPQEKETNLLLEADALWVSETLQGKLDKMVIEYTFGPGVKPMAYFKLCPPRKQDINSDIAVDRFLLDNGCELGKADLYERYNRNAPEAGEELVEKPEPEPTRFFGNETLRRGNQMHMELVRNAKERIAAAEAEALRPVFDRLDALFELADRGDEALFQMAARKFQQDLPELQKEVYRNPAGPAAFEALTASSLFNGLTEAQVERN